MTIGACNLIEFDEAKQRAAQTLLTMATGIDPKAQKKSAQRHGMTLRQAFDRYLDHHPRLRPASLKAYRSAVALLGDDWLDLPLREITRNAVEVRHRQIATEVERRSGSSGGTSANAAVRILGYVWRDAADYDETLPRSPVRLKKAQLFATARRKRHVAAVDLPRFWAGVQALENPVARDFLTLLLYTGMRRTEAASMIWEDVHFVARTIRIPGSRTKSKRDLFIPMSDAVFNMLSKRREIGKTLHVFPAAGASGHITEPKFWFREIAEATGINISCHDLRRSFSTVAEHQCKTSTIVLKLLLNHSTENSVTEGYVQSSVEDLREPVEKIARKIQSLCEPPRENVVVALR